MDKPLILHSIFLLALTVGLGVRAEARKTVSFDPGWKFHFGDVQGGEKPQLDDKAWRGLDLPHDWSIEGLVDPSDKDRTAKMEGPFDPRSPAGASGGYLNGGTAWYRKTFTLPQSAKGNRVYIQFDGAYMNSDVWVNGTHLGSHPYGYTSFYYDLSPFVKFGKEKNVLAVRLFVEQPCSRWYSGAGIYRHVWLTITNPVHVGQWGTYITTPEVSGASATALVRTRVINDGTAAAKVSLKTVITDPKGRKVAEDTNTAEIAASGEFEFAQPIGLKNVRLWSIEDPSLYTALSEVRVGGKVTDTYTTTFGVRTFEFTADKGFFLNGRHVDIKGVCNHHDLGCLGAAVYRRGIERQLEILKKMGCNAIRTSHNPPAPELLDLCDRMGFVVMDEAFDEWKSNKTSHGYGQFFDERSEPDLVSMLRRDRNHPSVIMWSIGNEINEQGAANGGEMAKRLADICRREDPTRAIVSGCNDPRGATRSGYADALDVLGINYNIWAYTQFKGKVLVASETASALSTRGEYFLVEKNGRIEIEIMRDNQCTSYDLQHPGWGYPAETDLRALKDHPWVAGEFVWTGFDYIGEPTPYDWPSRSSYFGIVDICGFPKDRFYIYQSQWTDKPMVHVLPHWNWEGFEGKEIPVWCYTNGESVELFLNGKSLGEKSLKGAQSLHLEWKVPYAPGVLRAVAKKDGKVIAEKEIRTAGRPAKLAVTPDRSRIAASGQDLSYVEVRVLDKDGSICPNADNKIVFGLDGPGFIAGVDNGDPINHEPFKANEHRAFHGLCLAVIKSGKETGEIRLTAAAEGLQPASAKIGVLRQ